MSALGSLHPIQVLGKNRTTFPIVQWWHYVRHGYKTTPALTSAKKELETLVRDGVVVIENFLDSETAKNIASELMPTMKKVMDGQYTGSCKFERFSEYGVYRLMNPEKEASSCNVFFDNPLIADIARAYVGPKTVSYQHMAELKPEPGKEAIADNYHFDDWKHRFKAFLYLTDVGEANAPLAYVKGSQRRALWRRDKEFDFYHKGHTEAYFTAEETERLKEKHGFKEISFTGKAGTLILADLRGLHRGTALKEDNRLILANFFDVR